MADNKNSAVSDSHDYIENVDDAKIVKNKMIKEIAFRFWKKALLFATGYIVCYWNWSLTIPILTIFTLVWIEIEWSAKNNKISSKYRASSMKKVDLLRHVEDLPSWVMFPDRERAEWLNEIISQLWPSITSYITKRFRGTLQTQVRKKFESFQFEDVDFGTKPPKIDGVKVYRRSITRDSIIVDFDVYYDGDCDIKFSMSGAQIGRIRDFQFGAELRLILKPLMIKTPIIGGIQTFFLNTPDINFELEGISGIPGFSYFIRQEIEKRIAKKFVFPNKISKQFTKSEDANELKSIEPAGVLRVHVFEAKDLERKDVTGKSDPYVILTVGAKEYRTRVIKRDLNPKWDFWCEFPIADPLEQFLKFEIFDQDDLNEDDFLGCGLIEIRSVIREDNDKWFHLDRVKHGMIHLRFTWLGLSSETEDLSAAIQEAKLLKVSTVSTALLTVYLDTAEDLQKVKSKKPDSYVMLTVGNNQEKSKTKRHTCNPVWEQGFILPVQDPENDTLIVSIIDKKTDIKLDQLIYHIRNLFLLPELQISKEVFFLPVSGKLIMSLQVRILRKEFYENEDSDSDSDEESVPKNSTTSSFRRNKSPRSSRRFNRSTSSNSDVSSNVCQYEEEMKEIFRSPSTTHSTMAFPSFITTPTLGQIELTLYYNTARQKLIVTIHKLKNLPLKDRSDIPDPYVKLKLLSLDSCKQKHKTKVVVDNCDPVFEETFEYLLSHSEFSSSKLVITVKSKKLFFNSNIIGQVILNFGSHRDVLEPTREWFELAAAEDSD